MTILILMALVVLAVVFAVFFLIFKLGWLIFKKHTNLGPLIAAGVCTLLCTVLVCVSAYKGYQAIVSPFQGIIAHVKANPAPIYGEHTYTDDTYPFTLTVYNGMDFSDWITIAGVPFKLGVDTNAFKKETAQSVKDDTLLAVLVRRSDAPENWSEELQSQLAQAQQQRRLELDVFKPVEINGLPAYQAAGEAYSNRGKINFWLTAVQTPQKTVYYVGVIAMQNTPQLAEQAQAMANSFSLVQP